MRKLSIVLIIALFALLPLSAQISVIYPTVKDLGVVSGWNNSSASALNWISQVTGSLTGPVGGDPAACHAFLWNSLTGMRDIGTVGEFCARGQQVDFFGRVAGMLSSGPWINPDPIRTFFYGLGGPMKDIGSVYDHDTDWTVLQQMNNRAEIVGYSHEDGTPNSHAFYWSRSLPTGMVDLQPLAPDGAVTSIAHGISDSGRITGHTVGFGPPRAFYMRSYTDAMIDLPSLGHFPILDGKFSMGLYINSRNQIAGEYKVAPSTNVVFFIPDPEGTTIYFTENLGGYGTTETRGLNDVGQVIGIYNPDPDHTEPPSGGYQTFRWTPGPGATVEHLQPLPADVLLGGRSQPAMRGINNLGQVVGTSYPSNTAVLWKAGTTVATALPSLAGSKCDATDINDFGVISGVCHTATGDHAVLWQPKLHFGF